MTAPRRPMRRESPRGSVVIWQNTKWGTTSSVRDVRDLNDLQDLLRSEYSQRIFYLEARVDARDEASTDTKLRSSADDLTGEDFLWLTERMPGEIRGVRV